MPSDASGGDFRLTYLTFAGSRFVAIGRALDTGAHPDTLVWTSADGRAWRSGQTIAVGRDGVISDVALGPTGALLAVGWTSASPAHAAAFTSPDGLRWTQVPDGPAFEGAIMRGLACDDRRCLAVGESSGASPSNAAAWTTTDGAIWSRTGPMSGLGDVGMRDVALTSQGAVAIGWAMSAFEGAPYVDNAAFWTTPPVALPAPVPPPAVQTIAGHWETLPPMSTARISPAVAVGNDGRIYVFGGKTRPAGTSTTIQATSVEIFDPATETWSAGTPIPGPGRNRGGAVTAVDGRIARWRSRGATSGVPIASAADGRLYDITGCRAWTIEPTTGQTKPRSATPKYTDFVSAGAGPGGLIWAAGAAFLHPSGNRSTLRSVVEAYDPATDSWFVAPRPAVVRWSHAVAGSGDRLYVIGGSTGTYSNSVEVFVVDSPVTSPAS